MKQCHLLAASLDLCQVLLFKEIQKDFVYKNCTDEYKVLRLQSLSEPRWTTRVKTADVIFDKSAELRTTPEMLKDGQSISSDTKIRIQRILKQEMRNERDFQRILDEARYVPGVEKNADGSKSGNIPRWMKYDDFITGQRLHTTLTSGEGSTDLLRRFYYEAFLQF